MKEFDQTEAPNETKNWDGFGGGGCLLFFGKFDKFCEVVGKVVVGICTLGIAPLVNHLVKKRKAKKNKDE